MNLELMEVGLELALDSAKGRPISNAQINEISEFELNQLGTFLKKWTDVQVRGGMTARYNCHGMTFASRRTGIYRPSDLEQVLREDEYQEVASSNVMPGDTIVYFTQDGDFDHSGIVVERPDPTFGVPRVVSKWGKAPEMLHWANYGPYDFSTAKYYRMKS